MSPDKLTVQTADTLQKTKWNT